MSFESVSWLRDYADTNKANGQTDLDTCFHDTTVDNTIDNATLHAAACFPPHVRMILAMITIIRRVRSLKWKQWKLPKAS
jgi:hypothetical protein